VTERTPRGWEGAEVGEGERADPDEGEKAGDTIASREKTYDWGRLKKKVVGEAGRVSTSLSSKSPIALGVRM